MMLLNAEHQSNMSVLFVQVGEDQVKVAEMASSTELL